MDGDLETSANSESAMGVGKQSNNMKALSKKRAILFTLSSLVSILLVLALVYFFGPKFVPSTKHLFITDNTNYTNTQPIHQINENTLEESLLPHSVEPLHYRLRIRPYLNDEANHTFTYDGRVSILMRCIKPTKFIVMHSQMLNITSMELSTSKSEEIIDSTRRYQRGTSDANTQLPKYIISKIAKITINSSESFGSKLLLRLEQVLMEGESYLLDLRFSGKIGDDPVGLFRSSYVDDQGKIRWMTSTHFHPIFARRVFPCFDEPSFASKFEISIARRTNMIALSNMQLKESETINDAPGWVWNHFQTSPPIPTHLVAFAISNLKHKDVAPNRAGPVIKIWAPQHLLDRTKYVAGIAVHILGFFENYFQTKYPLPKLDLVTVPNFGTDAMENFGLIFFRDTSLLLDDSSSTLDTKKHIFNVVAEKIAHQWLTQLNNPKSSWINEGLTLYTSLLAEKSLQPNWLVEESFVVDIMQKSLRVDALKGLPALEIEVNSDTEILQSFKREVQEKSACILRMVDAYLGDEFIKEVASYVKTAEHFAKNRTNNEDTPFSSIQNQKQNNKNTSITELLTSWTKNSGYPLLTISRDNLGIKIKQSKFGEAYESSDNWIIPFTYIYKNSSQAFEDVIAGSSKEIKIFVPKNNWVLFNLNQKGYCRVEYDVENWLMLINQLSEDPKKIPVINRAQLIDDSFELANADQHPHSISFDLIKYLRKESEYLPWKAAMNNLEYVEGILMETEHFGKYRAYLLKLLQADQVSYDFTVLDKLSILKLSKICSLKYKPCTSSALKILDDIRNGTFHKKIPYEISYVLFCTAIEEGNDDVWEHFWNETRSQKKSGMELRTLYLSLGCSRETWQLFSYLEKSLSEIQSQNVGYVWRSLTKNDVGRTVGLKFLEDRWDAVRESPERKFVVLKAIVEEFIPNLSSETDLRKVSSFYMHHKDDLKPFAGQIKLALEAIKSRINWKKSYMNDVVPALSML